MATLEDTLTQQQHHLFANTLIGRSRTCNLAVDDRAISGQHILLRWTGSEWEVRDLGSRNGTWVNGDRLEIGERISLAVGSTLGLGTNNARWVLSSDTAPHVAAVPLDGGETVLASGGLLSLPPDVELPEVSIYRSPRGVWVVEREESVGPLTDPVEAGGRQWRVILPEVDEETLEATTPTIQTIGLRFEVSRDEEFAQMIVLYDGREIPLEARSHHYLLLTLARLRLEDLEKEPEAISGHGWIHQSDLAHLLRIRERQVNLQIFRARKQLAEAGIEDAAGIVERRSPGRQLRLGIGEITVQFI